MFDNKVLLVTGGTGSFGKTFINRILETYPNIAKVIVYSRDELKQFDMSNEPRFQKHKKKMRYFIGDVRDKERLIRACESVDIIVHAAALKQVPAAEYNPMEFIKTNIWGAESVIEAAFQNKVQKVVALSTDKAAAPINLYGATKLCSDKLFIAANNVKGTREVAFSVVRYGNVMGSRGSVIPFFMKQKEKGVLPITDESMTRFNITLDEGIELVIDALLNAWGGEILVPKIPSYRITDVAKAVAPDCKMEIVGIRPGEKIHEEMITDSDSMNTVESDKNYYILPSGEYFDQEKYLAQMPVKRVPLGFKYNSGTNENFLTVEEIRDLIENKM